MRSLQLLILTATLIFSCKEDKPAPAKTTDFTIYIAGREPIIFRNPECEFNLFDKNQQQFNYTSSIGYDIFSTYWNPFSMDSTKNQIWIQILMVPEPPDELYNLDSLPKYLLIENSSTNNEHLYVEFQMELEGKRYTNKLWDTDPDTPPWERNDELYFEIIDYELNYHSDCLGLNLLYIQFEIQGMLYEYESLEKVDSIQINRSEMKLLFASD